MLFKFSFSVSCFSWTLSVLFETFLRRVKVANDKHWCYVNLNNDNVLKQVDLFFCISRIFYFSALSLKQRFFFALYPSLSELRTKKKTKKKTEYARIAQHPGRNDWIIRFRKVHATTLEKVSVLKITAYRTNDQSVVQISTCFGDYIDIEIVLF